jgi:hypothetical protein
MLAAKLRRALVSLSLVALVFTSTPGAVWAANIGTVAALEARTPADLAARDPAADLARVQGLLARDDVQQRMVALGVDPADAAGRVAALTPAELARLADQLERAPAGGDGLAIIGIVFLVLLVLEYSGAIDIFKKVP